MTRPPAGRARPAHGDSPLGGRATSEATRRFADRFAASFAPDFYRSAAGLTISSIGMGTYLGECDDEEDTRYVRALTEGIANGINLLHPAINHRSQRSERAVGVALRTAIDGGNAAREEIVVCSKGGQVPLEGVPPGSRQQYDDYVEH